MKVPEPLRGAIDEQEFSSINAILGELLGDAIKSAWALPTVNVWLGVQEYRLVEVLYYPIRLQMKMMSFIFKLIIRWLRL